VFPGLRPALTLKISNAPGFAFAQQRACLTFTFTTCGYAHWFAVKSTPLTSCKPVGTAGREGECQASRCCANAKQGV